MKQQQNFSTKLGIIPQGWHIKRLGEICTHFQSGTSITSKQLKKNGQYPVYGGNGLRGYTDKYTHDGPYILIGRQGALCGNINFVENKNFISEHAIAVQSNENMIWLKYKLEYWNLNRFSESSAQPGLSVKKLARQKLTIPPLPEQQKIAEIISTWDEAIEKQSQLIEKLELRKKGLMQQLLNGKKRLPGFYGKWEKVKLGEICEKVTRKNTEDNKNVMTISAQRGFVSQTDFFNKSIASKTLESYYLVLKNEFCYNKSYSNGYPMGAIKRLSEADKAVVTPLYICFNVKSCTYTDINFLSYYLDNGGLNQGLTKIANEGGRAHGLLNVTPKDFFNLTLNIPLFVEQTAIAQVLTTADHEIELAKQKLELFRQQKHGLMQQLLTGKKRIKY